MQVHVVNRTNARLYADTLAGFFRARHDIYVREKGWMPPAKDELEFDQYDTDDATYLIGVEDGRVVTGSRFVPTDRPHMLLDIFSHACERRVVRADAAEWTRGFLIEGLRANGPCKRKAVHCAATMEWCLSEGITLVGGIQEIYWMPLWRYLGWTVQKLGEPTMIDGDWCVAAYMEVSEQALAKTRQRTGLVQSALVRHGDTAPFVSDRPLADGSAIERMLRA